MVPGKRENPRDVNAEIFVSATTTQYCKNAAECDDGAISPIDHVNANHHEWLHGASYQLGSSRMSRRKPVFVLSKHEG